MEGFEPSFDCTLKSYSHINHICYNLWLGWKSLNPIFSYKCVYRKQGHPTPFAT